MTAVPSAPRLDRQQGRLEHPIPILANLGRSAGPILTAAFSEVPALVSPERCFDTQSCFSVPLRELHADQGAKGCRILTPESEIGRARVGVTRQFLEEAGEYHEKYTATEYFKALLTVAFDRCGLSMESPTILDIGSGSGNSVFPCLDLFDAPQIIATDISPDLLELLDHHVTQLGKQASVVPVCMDATRDLYAKESIDLVIGAAILHHLIEPEAAIVAALSALKPGGRAIFFEPFELGHGILRLAYKEILRRDAELEPDAQFALRLLEAQVNDIELRTGEDKSDEVFTRIDDKWLFTRRFFERIAERHGISELDTYPIDNVDRPYSDQTETNLRLAGGLAPDALPDWAWDILREYDASFSDDQKRDNILAGGVIFRK